MLLPERQMIDTYCASVTLPSVEKKKLYWPPPFLLLLLKHAGMCVYPYTLASLCVTYLRAFENRNTALALKDESPTQAGFLFMLLPFWWLFMCFCIIQFSPPYRSSVMKCICCWAQSIFWSRDWAQYEHLEQMDGGEWKQKKINTHIYFKLTFKYSRGIKKKKRNRCLEAEDAACVATGRASVWRSPAPTKPHTNVNGEAC